MTIKVKVEDSLEKLSKIILPRVEDAAPLITHHGEGKFSFSPYGGDYGVFHAEASLYSPYVYFKDRDLNPDGTCTILEVPMRDLDGWLQLVVAVVTFRKNLEAKQAQEKQRKKEAEEKKALALKYTKRVITEKL